MGKRRAGGHQGGEDYIKRLVVLDGRGGCKSSYCNKDSEGVSNNTGWESV